jgi:hypothetical protein
LAHLPEQSYRPPVAGQLCHLAMAGQRLQGAVVVGLARLDQARKRGPLVEAF